MRNGDRIAPAVISVGALAVVVGTFWPWVASGRRNRTSYQVFEIVERLGFAPDGAIGWGLRLWPVVPLIVVGATVAAWLERRNVAGVLGLLGATYAGGVGIGMRSAPRTGLVHVLGAPTFTAVAAAVLAIGAVLELAGVVRSRQAAA